jgi:WD40 repeat protein
MVLCHATLAAALCWSLVQARCPLHSLARIQAPFSQQGLAFLVPIPQRHLIATANIETNGMGELRVWDERDFSLKASISIPGKISNVAASQDGRFIAVGGGPIKIIETATWHVSELSAIGVDFQFIGNEPHLIVVGPGDDIQGYAIEAGTPPLVVKKTHTASISCLATGIVDKLMAIGFQDGTVMVWDFAKQLWSFSGTAGRTKLDSLLFVERDRCLITVGWPNDVTVWDLASGRRVMTKRPPSDSVTRLMGWRSGRFILLAGSGGTIRAWETDGLRECWTLSAGQHCAVVSISQDTERLYYGVPSGSVWQVQLKERPE